MLSPCGLEGPSGTHSSAVPVPYLQPRSPPSDELPMSGCIFLRLSPKVKSCLQKTRGMCQTAALVQLYPTGTWLPCWVSKAPWDGACVWVPAGGKLLPVSRRQLHRGEATFATAESFLLCVTVLKPTPKKPGWKTGCRLLQERGMKTMRCCACGSERGFLQGVNVRLQASVLPCSRLDGLLQPHLVSHLKVNPSLWRFKESRAVKLYFWFANWKAKKKQNPKQNL